MSAQGAKKKQTRRKSSSAVRRDDKSIHADRRIPQRKDLFLTSRQTRGRWKIESDARSACKSPRLRLPAEVYYIVTVTGVGGRQSVETRARTLHK